MHGLQVETPVYPFPLTPLSPPPAPSPLPRSRPPSRRRRFGQGLFPWSPTLSNKTRESGRRPLPTTHYARTTAFCVVCLTTAAAAHIELTVRTWSFGARRTRWRSAAVAVARRQRMSRQTPSPLLRWHRSSYRCGRHRHGRLAARPLPPPRPSSSRAPAEWGLNPT